MKKYCVTHIEIDGDSELANKAERFIKNGEKDFKTVKAISTYNKHIHGDFSSIEVDIKTDEIECIEVINLLMDFEDIHFEVEVYGRGQNEDFSSYDHYVKYSYDSELNKLFKHVPRLFEVAFFNAPNHIIPLYEIDLECYGNVNDALASYASTFEWELKCVVGEIE